MKRHAIDRLIGFFSPRAEASRVKSRASLELSLRAYDAAKTFNTDDWKSSRTGSANSELRGAQGTIRDRGRDAIRNNPYANRMLAVAVSNTIGHGIQANINAPNKKTTNDLRKLWKEWAETTLCDTNRRHNFYSLQALAFRSMVESGESLVLKRIHKGVASLQVAESEMIDHSKETGMDVQGIRLNEDGIVAGYHLHTQHPGEGIASSILIDAKNVMHLMKQDRPGQLRGVSWFHPIIGQLEDFKEYQRATLIGRKTSACFSAFITADPSDMALPATQQKAKREAEFALEPGSVRVLNPGESIQFASPPGLDGYAEYCRQTLRGASVGIGLTYESVVGDYSQSNYSSSRLAHLEMRKNVDMWRWNLIIPLMCTPSFEHFLTYAQSKGINVNGVTVEWVPPAWQMIDPTKEVSAYRDAIRAGLTTLPKAIREQGYEPEEIYAEIAESNRQLDALGIVLDSDPRTITKAGQIQSTGGSEDAGHGSKQND